MNRLRLTALAVVGLGIGCALLGVVYLLRTGATQKDPEPALEIIYPAESALFPVDMVAPTFTWRDNTGAKEWRVSVGCGDETPPIGQTVSTNRWRPGPDVWRPFAERSAGRNVTLTVSNLAEATAGGADPARSVTFGISPDPVVAPIFYRVVTLPFQSKGEAAVKHRLSISWHLFAPTLDRPPHVVLKDMETCANCHSFSLDGKTMGMDVDIGKDKGGYMVRSVEPEMPVGKDHTISWNAYRRHEGASSFGVLPQVSPDGRYVACTVKDLVVLFDSTANIAFSQNFYPVTGIIVIYDRETGKIEPLPGADDPAYVQTNPSWTPDGKQLLFARSVAGIRTGPGILYSVQEKRRKIEKLKNAARNGETFVYDLYRIPFNGGKGGTPEPVLGASHNGKSNYFPKFSPDGKWLVFCQARSFMLLQPDSTLYIIPAEGGTPRAMACNEPGKMNSWHSWSPNSRWMVFSSKRTGPYTQIWLTHIDEQGRDSPAVLIEGTVPPERAANIPEFVNMPADQVFSIDIARGR